MLEWLLQALFFIVMVVVSAVIFALIYMKLMQGAFSGNRAWSGGNPARAPDVTFDDVLGMDEAVQEAREVVEFLSRSRDFEAMGARVPRGILLVGPPGTGKTLLAKAIAREAGVPFYQLSGSDFVEVFVGVGAARVRQLYKRARKHPAAIVFIDELDALGRARTSGLMGGHEGNQTLNQFLVELDGFQSRTGGMVITIGATNLEETLDQALLRPGRFDRKIHVGLPDLAGRERILAHYLAGVKAGRDVDVAALARASVNMSGADLATVVNEAGILAVRNGHAQVRQADLAGAMERLGIGLQRAITLSEHERAVVAYHEAGHTLLSLARLPDKRVHKVSIIPTGRHALGYTWNVERADRFLTDRTAIEAELAMLLGGRAAELLVFGSATSGAASDLARATDLAERIVRDLGLSDMGPQRFRDRELSESRRRALEACVDAYLERAAAEARQILEASRADLDRLARALLEREVLYEAEILDLLRPDAA
ncbi:MAG: AAA family ATPase [Candidatus Sericytochromatia bacterium]|nr:AAA family ATPase [Candidatus Tanganyikabacteria bacterium]